MGLFDLISGTKPKSEETLFNEGSQFMEKREFSDAISRFDELLKINPNNSQAWYRKGLSFARRAEDLYSNASSDTDKKSYNRGHNQAVECFDQVIKITPEYAPAWGNKGRSLYNLEYHQEAITSFDRSIALGTKSDVIFDERGNSLFILSRYEEAIQSFDNAISLNSNHFSTWHMKGLALDSLGRYEEAITNFDRALELNPDDPDGYISLSKEISLKKLNDSNTAKVKTDTH